MSTQTSTERKIANKSYNAFVKNGVKPHRTTKIAPESFFKPLIQEHLLELENKQDEIESKLRALIGKPAFSDTGFILYQGDCVEMMKTLKGSDFQIDLTVTSPPYNIGKEYESIQKVEDFVDWCAKWMNQIYDLTVDTGSFWLNLGYFEIPEKGLCVPIPYLLWDKSPFYLLQEVVWKYGAGVSSKKRLSPRNEKWLFYVKDPKNYAFNLDEIRDLNVKYPNQKKNGKFRCNPLGKNPSDVWEFPKVTTGKNRSSKERTGHPAQFPLGVIERAIRGSSNACDLVMDPFSGSASVGIGAVAFGRIYLGFELRDDYCDISVERYKTFCKEKANLNSQRSLLDN